MKLASKYLAFARVAAIEALTERSELYGRIAFLGVLLGVFTALWRAVAEAGMPVAAAPNEMVWYLTTTEWIVLSSPTLFLQIQEDVRRGDVTYQLLRPVSYVGSMLARGAGMLCVRMPALGVAAFAWAYAFTGTVPAVSSLLVLVPVAFLAALLLTSIHLGIGLAAFQLAEVSPLYWVTQKSLFVLGGLMLPLEVYPGWLRGIAASTPFPSMLASPVGLLLGPAPLTIEVLSLSGSLVLWLAVTLFLWSALFRRATRSLELGGG
jgi:ABC-2 type transport system permease protein